jgi:hypothetical protein
MSFGHYALNVARLPFRHFGSPNHSINNGSLLQQLWAKTDKERPAALLINYLLLRDQDGNLFFAFQIASETTAGFSQGFRLRIS